MYTYTTVREIVESLNLEVLNEGNLDLKIDIPNIYQIGYELVGFLDKESDELNKYINICSLKESRFIATFSKENNEEVEKPQRNESQDSEIKTIKTKKEPVEQLTNEEVKTKLNNEIREIEGTYTP